jgi:hypothetical protein
MIRGAAGTVAVAIALVALLLLALIIALAHGELHVLALGLTEHLFAIVLAVFVFERMLAWREERRWLAAKNWLYMILLETIDDLLKELLPATVPQEEGVETDGPITIYKVAGERIHFGEAVAHSPLELLVTPDEKDLQSQIIWYAKKLEPPRYADMAKAALSDAREQVRDMFGSSARLMEADITAMLISFEQAALAAIRHLDSALDMRHKKKLGDISYLDNDESAKRRERVADEELAFVSAIIVESVVDSAIKPKAWLEEQMHSSSGGEGRSLFGRLRGGDRAGGMGSVNKRT